MTTYRQIHIDTWDDEWMLDLEPLDKLLFTYLFSNNRTKLTGLYDIPLKKIAFETGLDVPYITAALDRFARAGKVFYEQGRVWVVNLLRHNAKNMTSDKIRAHIRTCYSEIPDCPLRRRAIAHYNGMVPEKYRIDTVSIPILQEQEQEQDQDTDQEQETETEQEPAAGAAPPQSPARKGNGGAKLPPGKSEFADRFLDLFGALRFKNKTQLEAVLALERSYGEDVVLEAARWAATKGMQVGSAITAISSALPTWGKSKGQARAGPTPAEPKSWAGIRAALEDYQQEQEAQRGRVQ